MRYGKPRLLKWAVVVVVIGCALLLLDTSRYLSAAPYPMPSADRVSAVQDLVQRNDLHPQARGPSWCMAPAGPKQVADPDVQTILDTARAETILILVHGFRLEFGAWQKPRVNLEEEWRSYINAARNVDPATAVCLVNWDPDLGLSGERGGLTALLHAIRLFADDPQLFSSDRTITLIGHSAGGNHAKWAYVSAQERLASTAGTGMPTRTRLVTLGTPHMGTPLAAGGQPFALLATLLRADQDPEGARLIAKVQSRGLSEMRVGDPTLNSLDRRFLAMVKPNDGYYVGSSRDALVPLWSACPRTDTCYRLDNLDHSGLMAPFGNPSFTSFFSDIIRGRNAR